MLSRNTPQCVRGPGSSKLSTGGHGDGELLNWWRPGESMLEPQLCACISVRSVGDVERRGRTERCGEEPQGIQQRPRRSTSMRDDDDDAERTGEEMDHLGVVLIFHACGRSFCNLLLSCFLCFSFVVLWVLVLVSFLFLVCFAWVLGFPFALVLLT